MRRWKLLAGVLLGAALVALVQTWLRARHPALDPVRDYSCLRTNRWGTKALRETCRALGYETRVWRKPADKLPDDVTVLLMIAPADALVPGEFDALRKWVRGGGTLVLAPLPAAIETRAGERWRLTAGFYLAAWLGAVPQLDVFEGPGEVAVGENPWAAYKVKTLMLKRAAAVDYAATRSAVKRRLADLVLHDEVLGDLPPVEGAEPQGKLVAAGRTVGLAFDVGAGHVALLSEPDVFSNSALGQADNALLAAAIIFPRAADGAILFDEYHHGRARQGKRARASQRTLGSVIFLFLAALTVYLLLGAIRMGRAHVLKPRPRRSVMEYVRAVAWLYQRAGLRAAALELLERSLRRTCALRLAVPADASPERMADAARQRGAAWADRLEAVLRQCQAVRADPQSLSRSTFVALARQIAELQGEIQRHGR